MKPWSITHSIRKTPIQILLQNEEFIYLAKYSVFCYRNDPSSCLLGELPMNHYCCENKRASLPIHHQDKYIKLKFIEAKIFK